VEVNRRTKKIKHEKIYYDIIKLNVEDFMVVDIGVNVVVVK
jgi:hypothetical protein